MKDKLERLGALHSKMADHAASVHAAVNQMYDDKPYGYHLFSVVEKTLDLIPIMHHEVMGDVNILNAIVFGALFHDSIEDARLTYNDVHKIALSYMSEPYATAATEIVYALTNEKGRTRADRANDKYYNGIVNTQYASMVKLADRLANMSHSKENGHSMYAKYVEELPHFLEQLGISDELAKVVFSEFIDCESLSKVS